MYGVSQIRWDFRAFQKYAYLVNKSQNNSWNRREIFSYVLAMIDLLCNLYSNNNSASPVLVEQSA